MPSVMHSLGELEHIYDKQNLKLKTTGCITVSSPHVLESPYLAGLQDLDTLVSSKTWVPGGFRLQFQIRLIFEDIAVSSCNMSQAIEDLGIALCNAEMWSQLGLDASLSLPENDVGTQQYPNKLIISLTRQAASQADVKPPSGVPSVCLENISMVLCLSTCRRSRLSSKARADSNKSRDTLNENAALGAHLRCNNVDKRWDSHMLSLKWAQDIRDPSEERSRFGIAKAELNPSRIMTDPFSMKTSPTISGSTVSSKSSLSQSTDGMYITGRCPQRHGYAIHEISFRDLLMMVDMSLRTMISGHLATRSVGIILSSDAGYPKLVDASPALFCPGYFKTLFQRNTLLSTVAQSMFGIYRRTTSSNLKYKMERLLHESRYMVYLEDISLSHEEFHINGTPLLAAIKSRLWFLIQSKLSSYLASQKLKPFVASKTMHRVSSGSYEMLDEAFEDGEDAMEVDNQLFESPLGDLEQNLFGEEEAGFHGGEYKDLFWEELDIGEEVLDTCFEQNFGHDDDLLDDGEEGNQPITYGSSRPAKLFGKVSSLE